MSIEKLQNQFGVIRQRLLEIYTSIAHTVAEIDLMGGELNQLLQQSEVKEEELFKCRYCEKSFKKKQYRNTHENRSHKVEQEKFVQEKFKHVDNVKSNGKRKGGFMTKGHSLNNIKIMLEANKTMTVKEICKKFKISNPTWYTWRKVYGNYGNRINEEIK